MASLDWSVWWWPFTTGCFVLAAIAALVTLIFVGRSRTVWLVLCVASVAVVVLVVVAWVWAQHHLG